MVERVAARPVDQADVGIGERLAVVAERSARVEQHVGDAGDGDELADRVAALGEGRDGHGVEPAPVVGDGAQRVAEAAAGQADLAKDGSQRRAHPDRHPGRG